MYIQYLGHSCFKFISRDNGTSVSIVTDPYGPENGLKMPNTDADIVTISHAHKDHNNLKAIKGQPYVVDSAGEYDLKSVFIQGIDAWHDDKNGAERGPNIIYRLGIEDVVVTHLGDLGHLLDNKQVEKLEGTDILLVPIGGTYTLDVKKAIEVINQIEPRIVIPMHYQQAGLTLNLAGVDKFIKEIGIKPVMTEDKYKVNKKDLPAEDMDVVVFTV